MKIIAKQIEKLEALFEEFQATHENPCGGSVYYDEDEETSLPDDTGQPWRVHYDDRCDDEAFRHFHEAETAIRAYVWDERRAADE